MKVIVKLLATYRKALPPGWTSPFEMGVQPGTTVEELVTQLPVPPEQPKVVLVNGRSAPIDHVLQDGDEVALFPAVAGG